MKVGGENVDNSSAITSKTPVPNANHGDSYYLGMITPSSARVVADCTLGNKSDHDIPNVRQEWKNIDRVTIVKPS